MALDRLVNLTVDILQNSIKRLEQGRDDRLLEKGFALFSQRIPVHLKPSLHIVALDIDILQQFISRVFQVRHKQAFYIDSYFPVLPGWAALAAGIEDSGGTAAKKALQLLTPNLNAAAVYLDTVGTRVLIGGAETEAALQTVGIYFFPEQPIGPIMILLPQRNPHGFRGLLLADGLPDCLVQGELLLGEDLVLDVFQGGMEGEFPQNDGERPLADL